MKRNRRHLVLAALFAVAALIPAGADAQVVTSTLAVSANVTANCTVSVAPVEFGPYDPLGTHASTALDAEGGVTVACTKGSVPVIALGAGGNPASPMRQMSNGSGGLLQYQLFQDTGRNDVWATGADAYTALPAPSKVARTFTVYGRVASGLDPVPGTYGDTVVVTVNF